MMGTFCILVVVIRDLSKRRQQDGSAWERKFSELGETVTFYLLSYVPPLAGCQVLVNPWCSLVTFIMHLKQKAQVPPEVTIALLAEDGQLVRLEEGIAQAPSMACSLLQEHGTYVLVQVIKGKDGTPTRYESLLDNLDDHCPELAGKYQDKWRSYDLAHHSQVAQLDLDPRGLALTSAL
ncbi:putative gene 867 [Cricetulus griseus]